MGPFLESKYRPYLGVHGLFCDSIFSGGVPLSALEDLLKRAKLRHTVCLVQFFAGVPLQM